MNKIIIGTLIAVILAMIIIIIGIIGNKCESGACNNPFEVTTAGEDTNNKDLSAGFLEKSSDATINDLDIDGLK